MELCDGKAEKASEGVSFFQMAGSVIALVRALAQRSLSCQRGAQRIPRCLLALEQRSLDCLTGAQRITTCLFRAVAAVMLRLWVLQQAHGVPCVSAGTPRTQEAIPAVAQVLGHCNALAASVPRWVLRSSGSLPFEVAAFGHLFAAGGRC